MNIIMPTTSTTEYAHSLPLPCATLSLSVVRSRRKGEIQHRFVAVEIEVARQSSRLLQGRYFVCCHTSGARPRLLLLQRRRLSTQTRDQLNQSPAHHYNCIALDGEIAAGICTNSNQVTNNSLKSVLTVSSACQPDMLIKYSSNTLLRVSLHEWST